jgi:hypothetical protein
VSKDVLVNKMALGSDSAKMRQRASRLLDLATRSHCEGRPDYASLLTNLATEILEHARDLDERNGTISTSIGNRNGAPRPDAA